MPECLFRWKVCLYHCCDYPVSSLHAIEKRSPRVADDELAVGEWAGGRVGFR
ncbi:hypothetical protein HRbin36_00232 [bacterium HR36]|nr:hypothetical protein HRbin36_00232 [bacterium HR36]